MNDSELDAKKIEVLGEHQEAIGNLYHIYSERSPDLSLFWSQLADDKFRHVIWIHSLLDGVRQGKVRLDRNRFQMEAIRAAFQFVRRQISSARKRSGSFPQTFPVALSIETTILDKKFFEAFESDLPELRELTCKLLEETKEHLKKLRAETSPR